ncbi:hypothetical protein V7138_07110 [Bacillus sp. JJ1533]|uniref:hypothetical protein n=1 Tax=Bacillus sp. JJ1533 TaxID=3122959 RepID=UPI0030004373
MQPYIYQDAIDAERDKEDFHKKCKKHLYQIIQIELKDGSVYQGILHSYDREKMYILMPKTGHSHFPSHTMGERDDSRLFPFFGPFGLFGFPFFGIRRFGPFFPFFI